MSLPAKVLRGLARRKQSALARVSETAPSPLERLPAPDLAVVARELASTFARTVDVYKKLHGLSTQEAAQRVADSPPLFEEQALSGPVENVLWGGLDAVARRDPDRAEQRWAEIRQAARETVHHGHQAGKALEVSRLGVWPRAVYLAVRAELEVTWQPRNGQELQLIDQMSQAQVMIWRWQEVLVAHTWLADRRCKRGTEQEQRFEPRTMSQAEETEEAMRMVESWQKFYLRALEPLLKLRRRPASVVVQRAGQVNLGQNQANFSGV
jgi:hypothetical protein